MSTLGTNPITSARLTLSRYGGARADVVMSSGDPPTDGARMTLTLGGFAVVMTIFSSGLDIVGRPHAVLISGAGWERSLAAPLSYQSDAGIRLSTVLRDLAALAGEPIEQPADITIENRWDAVAHSTGEPVALRNVLASLVRDGYVAPWRCDADGVTRFGARTGVDVTARATLMSNDAALQVATYGLDDPSQFIPGNLLNGLPIVRCEILESAGTRRATVWQ